MADVRLGQRLERALARIGAFRGVAAAARGVEDREVELLVIGFERQEQLEHLVEHFGGARVAAVDLVDDDDRLEAECERLAGDELRSEEHTSELQVTNAHLVCRLLLEKKKQ